MATTLTKKFHFDDEKPPIIYRPGTSDEHIIQTVLVNREEYVFPFFTDSPNRVFDIGANIGIVSVILANVYPHAKIHAFEPVAENFKLLVENTKTYKNVVTHNVGLGHGTRREKIFKSDDPTNLGGFSTKIEAEVGEEIEIIRMATFCEKVGVPDVIKIDCEGSEFEILNDLHSEDRRKIKWITGELHGIDDFKLIELLSRDFKIQTQRRFDDKIWHFHARSKTWSEVNNTVPQ